MRRITEEKALETISGLLRDLIGSDPHASANSIQKEPGLSGSSVILDDWSFDLEYKNKGDAHAVSIAIDQLRAHREGVGAKSIPVVVVPFMGDVGRRLCAEKGVSWLDLSGNADIRAPGLRINVEGKPNQFKAAGRPKNVFAPKSARITRHLLLDPERYVSQRELTNETRLDEGLVSRVVREMEKMELLDRNSAGAVRPNNPQILLDAWYERYDFSKHDVVKGVVAARTSDEVIARLSESLAKAGVGYAMTGLSGAWLWSRYAAFRTSTVFLPEHPDEEMLRQLGFLRSEKGTNVWLVIANDADVFAGASSVQGIRCAHPLQVYLDLKAHPERANEAAVALRNEYLNWKSNAS